MSGHAGRLAHDNIEGRTVRLDTHNASKATIDPGPGGLCLTGEVTVSCNGHRAYEGPA